MAHNIALDKSAQSAFTKAVKSLRPLIKRKELKILDENDATSKVKGRKVILGKTKQVDLQTRKQTWKPHGRGVVILRHIPRGFQEEEMSSYFNQFGRVTRLNLVRSQKSAVKKSERIYKTVILPVVHYGCETWILTLREEQRLRVFENKVLRKIFRAKRDEVTGEWRKLHNAGLHALYYSPDIIRNIISRRLRWAGHVACMGESRNAYRVLVGRSEGIRPLGRPRRRWEDNIKMDLREAGYDVENDHKVTQTDVVNFDELKRNINRLHVKITRRLNQVLQEKQNEITKTTEKLQLIERDPLHKELENVKKEADEGSIHAKFILDQLLNHRKRILNKNILENLCSEIESLLCRCLTGNPRGYAFIEFLYSEVAQVVAETMNNYLMCGRLLKAEYIPGDSVGRGMFRNTNIRPGNCLRSENRKKTVMKTNRKLTPAEEKEDFQIRNKQLEKLKKQLEKSGIELDCQIENGVVLLSNDALKSEKEQKPVLEIDESDDEIEFKVHPNVTKVIKRKSQLKSSPTAKKMKTEAVKNVSRTPSSSRNKQELITEMKVTEALENQSGKKERKHTRSNEASPVLTPEKKDLMLLQGFKAKKEKGKSSSLSPSVETRKNALELSPASKSPTSSRMRRKSIGSRKVSDTIQQKQEDVKENTSLNFVSSPRLTPSEESKSKRKKSADTPSVNIKNLKNSSSKKFSVTSVSKSTLKRLSNSPPFSTKKLKAASAKK
ncbi:hypothetical protein ANN_09863 [Periplaneta americana]|uniref:RRM domain-containing protein n=1 Tax=Periplaneta americana TaxID=6978 RepID=A0ABQ8TMW3_PERAM|nr:hypothetical protein ANN_09863 [Periplaneta americana]